jgi:hypothetical protein
MTAYEDQRRVAAPNAAHWDSPPVLPEGLRPGTADGALAAAPVPLPWTRLATPAAAHAGVAGAALLCWAVALTGTDLGRISGYGLLAALPPAYYAALALLAGGFAVAATRRRVQPAVLGLYVVALVVVLHATTALLYSEPRYAWTYKHLGVIDYIAGHGSVDRWIDIYQNWPGFFALNAWFSRATGVAPIDYAAWAQPAFELANVAAILFALRGVTRDPRLQWTAVWIFVVANWIGQDYLAPQAFGFLVVEVILGLVLRCTPASVRQTALGRWVDRRVDRIAATARRGRLARRPARAAPPMSPAAAVAVGALCSLAVVVAHQLSPVMLIVSVAALTLMTGRPPLWVVCGLIALEAWWLYLSHAFLLEHFAVFSVDVAASARPTGPGLPGAHLGIDVSRAAMLGLLLVAAAGVIRRLRAGHTDVAPLALAAAPVLVVGIQAYGGEAPLRAYLFALPWLAFFAAAACDATSLRGSWRLVGVTVLLGIGTLFGYFGQEMVNRIGRDDVAASRWFLDHTPPDASLMLVAPNLPARLNGRYAERLDSPLSLVETPGFRPHRLGPQDVPVLERLLRKGGTRARYLALTPSGERYARFYGLAPGDSFARLGRALAASPDFRLVFRRGAAQVFEYVERA